MKSVKIKVSLKRWQLLSESNINYEILLRIIKHTVKENETRPLLMSENSFFHIATI